MEYSLLGEDVKGESEGFLVDAGSLYARLATLSDRRHRRGVRYPLALILLLIVLGKLVGEDSLAGIADWIRLHRDGLAKLVGLRRAWVPHGSTYSRVLARAVDLEEFQAMVTQFFARESQEPDGGESVVISLDGKTLRGTIPAGDSKGVHLLAAYVPSEGLVLMQVDVGRKENEVTVAPRLLHCLDLRRKVVTGDALLAQRELSIQIVEGGGDYIWTVKENQTQLYRDIETLFQPERCRPGFSPAMTDFRRARTLDKGHGRLEQRTLIASSALKGYIDWPYAEQVFKVERHRVRSRDGKTTHEVAYGVTSRKADTTPPEVLLHWVRMHWHIENRLHYRRDETLREDRSTVRTAQAPHMLAAINNLVLTLCDRLGITNVAQARRRYNAHPKEALDLLISPIA